MKIGLTGHYSVTRLVKTSLPLIAMMIVTSIYSVIDGYFVSNFAGSTEFASMNLVWPVLSLASAIGLMIGTGGSALVSKTLGEGDRRKAEGIFTMLVRVSIAVGCIVSVLLIVFMKDIVTALGAKGDMIPLAEEYGRIVSLGMVGFILQMEFQSFYMTAERPQLGTMMSIVSGVVNIALDALFIIAFGWGLEGAAVATAVSLGIGGAFPLVYFSSSSNKSNLKFIKGCGTDWKALGKACSNGISEYVGNVALSIVSIGYNIQLMKYIGENGVSAYGVIMYVGFIFGSVFIGYNLCASQVIAYNYGAGNRKELRSLLGKSLILIGTAGLILTAAAQLSAPLLSRIFVGYDDGLSELTVHALRLYMVSFLLCGFNTFCSAWFTALNNGIVSAVAAFSRTLVLELGTVFILPSIIGIDGIWFSVSVAEILAFLMTLTLIFCFRKRYL